MIRRATAADAGALARERWALRAALDPVVETEEGFVARCTAWMAARLGADADRAAGWRCWVDVEGGRIIATLWLLTFEKLPNPVGEPERHGYVSSFFVAPEWRGRGVGSRLLETCLRACDEEKFDAVILWPTPRSRPLYLRHGFACEDDLLARRKRPAPS